MYHYVDGEKARFLGAASLYGFSQLVQQKLPDDYPDARETKQRLKRLEGTVIPKDPESLKEQFQGKPWSELSGVEYIIRQGESAQSIKERLGLPDKIRVTHEKNYEEAWEYPWCTLYFSKKRLRRLEFKKREKPSYQAEYRTIFGHPLP